jgi:hypothetical protein
LNTIRFSEELTRPLPSVPNSQTTVSLAVAAQVVSLIELKSSPLQISRSTPTKKRPPNTIFFDDEYTRPLPNLDPKLPLSQRLHFVGQVFALIQPSSPMIEISRKKQSRPQSTNTGPRTLAFDDEICIKLPDLNLPVGEIPEAPQTNIPMEASSDDPYRGAPVFQREAEPIPQPPALPQKQNKAEIPGKNSPKVMLAAFVVLSLVALYFSLR